MVKKWLSNNTFMVYHTTSTLLHYVEVIFLQQFKGLFMKEWLLYRSWISGIIISSGITIFLVPFVLTKFYTIENLFYNSAFIIIAFWFALITITAIAQLVTSFSDDRKHLDVWLHNPASLYTLIGAKFCFTFIFYLLTILFITFIGCFIMMAAYDLSYFDLIGLQVFIIIPSIILSPSLLISSFFFYVLYSFLHKYIGKFSIIAIPICIIGFLFLLEYVSNTYLYEKLLLVGPISTEWAARLLPPIDMGKMYFDFTPIYIVEEVVSWGILITFFLLSVKWFEKVVSR